MAQLAANDLIRYVVRAFYDPISVVIMDAVMRENKAMRDDDIATMLHLPQKLVRKVLQDLKLGCIVENSTKQMEVGPGGRASSHLYWYIDYKRVIDIVKYKLFILKSSVTKQIEKEKEVQMYECPNTSCNSKFTAYDAASLMGPTGVFCCENCNTELQEVKGVDTFSRNHEMQTLMSSQLKPIVELLKELEGQPMPTFPKPHLAQVEGGETPVDYTMKKAVISSRSASDSAVEIIVDLGGSHKTAAAVKKESAHTSKAPPPWMVSQTSTTTTQTAITNNNPNTNNTHNPTHTPQSTTTTSTVKTEDETQMDSETYSEYVKQYLEELKKQEMEKIKPEKIEDEFVHAESNESEHGEKNITCNIVVYVKGEQKNLLDVTDVDKDNMTPEEYEDYGTKYMEWYSELNEES